MDTQRNEFDSSLVENAIACGLIVNNPYSKAVFNMAKSANMVRSDFWEKYHAELSSDYNTILSQHHFNEMCLTKLDTHGVDSPYLEYSHEKDNYYLRASKIIEAIDNDSVYCDISCLPPNSGKSTGFLKAARIIDSPESDSDYKDCNYIDLSGRVSITFGRNTEEWQQLGFKNQYDDDGITGNITDTTFSSDEPIRFNSTINNLPTALKRTGFFKRNDNRKTVVLLDEWSQTAQQLHGDACKKKFIEADTALKKLLQCADKVIVLDASLTDNHIDMLSKYFLPSDKRGAVTGINFDIKKWNKVKAVFMESERKYISVVKNTVDSILKSTAKGKCKGVHIPFNRNIEAVTFVEQLISDATPELDRNERPRYYTSPALINELGRKDSKLKLNIAFYFKPNPRAESRIDLYTIDYSKKGAKAVIHQKGVIGTVAFNSNPKATLEKYNIQILVNTPSMERGIDINNMHHFDTVIANFKPSFHTSGADGGFQAITRCRDSKYWFIYIEPLKDARTGLRTLDTTEFDTVEKLAQKIFEGNEEFKGIIPKEIVGHVKNDLLMCNQLGAYIRNTKLSQYLYAPLLYKAVCDATGIDNVSVNNYTHSSVSLREKKGNDSPIVARAKELANLECELDATGYRDLKKAVKEGFDVPMELWDSMDMIDALTFISLSHDNPMSLIQIPSSNERNFSFDELTHEQKIEAFTHALTLRNNHRQIETCIALQDDTIAKKCQRAMVASGLAKKVGSRDLIIAPVASDRHDLWLKMQRNATVLKGILKACECDNVAQLLNKPDLDSVVINNKLAAKIVGKNDAAKPMLTLSNAVKDLGFELEAKRLWSDDSTKKVQRGDRIYTLKLTETLSFYKNRTANFQESEFTKLQSEKGDKKLKKLMESVSI